MHNYVHTFSMDYSRNWLRKEERKTLNKESIAIKKNVGK